MGCSSTKTKDEDVPKENIKERNRTRRKSRRKSSPVVPKSCTGDVALGPSESGCAKNVVTIEEYEKSPYLDQRPKTAKNIKEPPRDGIITESHEEEIDTKPHEEEINTKPHEEEIDTKPHEEEIDTESHEEEIDTKPHEEEIATKPHEEEIDTKPHEEEIDTKPYEEEIDTKPHEEEIDTKPHEEEIDTKPHEEEIDTKPHEEEIDTKPYEEEIDTKPHEEEIDTKPHEEEIDTKPHEEEIDTKPHEEEIDTKPHEEEIDTKPHEKEIDTKPHDEVIDTKPQEEEIDTKPHEEEEWQRRTLADVGDEGAPLCKLDGCIKKCELAEDGSYRDCCCTGHLKTYKLLTKSLSLNKTEDSSNATLTLENGTKEDGLTGQLDTGVDMPEDTEGDKLEGTEVDMPEDTEGDKPEGTEGDKPEGTEVDKPEGTEGDKLEGTEGDKLEGTEGDKLEGTEGDKLEGTEGDKLEGTKGDKLEDTEGDKLEGTEGDKLEDAEGDKLEGTNRDKPEGTEVDMPEDTEGDKPEGTEVDKPEGTEGDKPEGTEGDKPEGTEGDKPEGTEGDKLEGTEGDKLEGTEGDKLEGTEGDKLEGTEGDKLEGTEGDKLEGTEGDKLEGTEGDKLEGTEGDKLEGTEGDKLEGTEGDKLEGTEGDKPEVTLKREVSDKSEDAALTTPSKPEEDVAYCDSMSALSEEYEDASSELTVQCMECGKDLKLANSNVQTICSTCMEKNYTKGDEKEQEEKEQDEKEQDEKEQDKDLSESKEEPFKRNKQLEVTSDRTETSFQGAQSQDTSTVVPNTAVCIQCLTAKVTVNEFMLCQQCSDAQIAATLPESIPHQTARSHNTIKTCKLPGCTRPCWREPSGHVHDYCRRGHAEEHKRMKEQNRQENESSWSFGNLFNWFSNSSGQKGPINFYHRHEPYFEFTNFYEAPITINDKRWATAENYFQGQKFIGSPFEEAVRQCSTAREALNLSRLPEVKQWQRKDWFEANVDVMRVGLYAKFTQHRDLQELLLGTGKREIIEHTDKDRFWGDGGDGSGVNMLGKLLVELRKKLKKEISNS